MILACCKAYSQTYTRCDVYQYKDSDSLNKKVEYIQTFNTYGNLTTEKYNNRYWFTNYKFRENSTFQYFYKDTLLIKEIYTDEFGYGSKRMTLYYYNDKRQLIKEECSSCEKRLKKNRKVGLAYGRCIVTSKDYRKKPTWKKLSIIHYKYNEQGKPVLKESPNISFSTEDKYTWEYDSLGRVKGHNCYGDGRLLWTREYVYFDGGYTQIHTWYDSDGKTPCYLLQESWRNTPQWHTTYYFDDKNRVVKEVCVDEKGTFFNSETTEYNTSGKIAKTVFLDKDGHSITHQYVYY